MNDNEVTTAAEEPRRLRSSLHSKFEEIAQTFLNMLSSERGNGKDFALLQDYLDGSVLVNGAYCRRRTVLLAIHDVKEEQEAPLTLQNNTLVKLEALNIRPMPAAKFYRDVATAILRMEVVVRLEAMQALVQTTNLFSRNAAPGAGGRLSPAHSQTSSFEPARKAPRHIPN